MRSNHNSIHYSVMGTTSGFQQAALTSLSEPILSYIVEFTGDVSAALKKSFFRFVDASSIEPLAGSMNQNLSYSFSVSKEDLKKIELFQRNVDIFNFIEDNSTLWVDAVPNDPYFTTQLWGAYGDKTTPKNVYGSQASEAWQQGITGSSKIVIGNIDTGIDFTHEDLYLNIWLNQNEIPKNIASQLFDTDSDGLITFRDLNNNINSFAVKDLNGNKRIDAGDLLKDKNWVDGLDNDGNRYKDDIIGWDFYNNDNNPYDDNGHGTHTSGTIGALGNNGVGIAGVNWNVEIMALKFLSAKGSGSLGKAVEALNYYTAMASADLTPFEFIGTSNSWGGGGYSQSLHEAIIQSGQQDLLFVAAAGNGGTDRRGDNNDAGSYFPSSYSTLQRLGYEAVISVAAIDQKGGLASFSNYGKTSVDIGAPGVGIFSTVPGGYSSLNGTSMATPHVTGALALLASINPDLTAGQLREQLLATAAPTSSLNGRVVSNGRLDISAMVGVDDAPVINAGITVYGSQGSDTVFGSSGDDIIYGISSLPQKNALGRASIDYFSGGEGNDTFVVGDARGVFYNDGIKNSAGFNDYAIISDFQNGDLIQLKNGRYFFNEISLNGSNGVGVWWDSNQNRRYDVNDEFIVHVPGVVGLTTQNLVYL